MDEQDGLLGQTSSDRGNFLWWGGFPITENFADISVSC